MSMYDPFRRAYAVEGLRILKERTLLQFIIISYYMIQFEVGSGIRDYLVYLFKSFVEQNIRQTLLLWQCRSNGIYNRIIKFNPDIVTRVRLQ